MALPDGIGRSQFESLHQRTNDIASQAMLVDDAGEETALLLAAIAQLGADASAAGLAQVGETAAAVSRGAATGDAVREGLARLQQELERACEAAANGGAETGSPQPAAEPEVDPDMLREFLVEARDHLAQIESQVLTLENDHSNLEAVHSVFRGFHTIKGLAGFLDLQAIQKVAHEVETLLHKVRSGEIEVSGGLVDVVLAGADYVRTDIQRVEAVFHGGGIVFEEAAPHEDLLARVRRLLHAPPPRQATAGNTGCAPSSAGAAPPAAKAPDSRIVKVDTGKLDFLVDMVGELVIAQSMIRHDGELSTVANPQLQRNLARLSRITGEVQKTAMSMRMVPVGQLLQKSVRLVRDLVRKSGKQAEVELSGEDTELDRTIVEDLNDPLVHMIRNAADHGIETAQEREQAGKNPVARIGLKAYHQAGHIVIEVSDDGRGLDRERILAKARERGLLTHDGSTLSDQDVFALIFEPGFSTAETVTEVSGRGVGMDVVRRQLQKMRGQIEIDSQKGRGTTFYLKLPLTLAIIDGLVVAVGRERYIVPIFAVREIFRPQPDGVFTVENRDEMIRVRGRLLPVIRLHERFGVEPRSREITEGVVVVANSGSKRFCLLVDELIGKQEVVIKNLGDTFRQVSGLAGGAILGDGRVGLILDMEGVYGSGGGVRA